MFNDKVNKTANGIVLAYKNVLWRWKDIIFTLQLVILELLVFTRNVCTYTILVELNKFNSLTSVVTRSGSFHLTVSTSKHYQLCQFMDEYLQVSEGIPRGYMLGPLFTQGA